MPMQPPVLRSPGYRTRDERRREYERARFKNMDGLEQECRRFYSRKVWHATRDRTLRNNPLCNECKKKDRLTPATEVDHEPQLKIQLMSGQSGLDERFLQALCKSCHSSKTAREMMM